MAHEVRTVEQRTPQTTDSGRRPAPQCNGPGGVVFAS
jgi:hypothetical protein